MDGPLTLGRRTPTTTPVLAAGCVAWRPDPHSGQPLLAVVHRPRYGDWSLPKGKCDPDEYPTTTAVRETYEETGARVALARRLPCQVYAVSGNGRRRAKVVHWWLADVIDGAVPGSAGPRIVPGMASGEIDEVAWLGLEAAAETLTHDRDRTVLEAVGLAPLATTTVVIVRHASAGSRSKYLGDDRDRPLDALGMIQRGWITEFARCFAATSVVSAEPARCIQTVQSYADLLGVPVAVDPALGERANARDTKVGLAALRRLAARPGRTLVSSQGGVIPHVVRALHEDAGFRLPGAACPKGGVWVLSFDRGTLVAADFHPSLDPAVSPLPPGALVAAGEPEEPSEV